MHRFALVISTAAALRLVVPSLWRREREDQGPVRRRERQVPAAAAGPGHGVLSALTPSMRRRAV